MPGRVNRPMADVGPVLTALRDAGISTARQARALGVSQNTICSWRAQCGIADPVRLPPTALPGETWRDRPDLGVRVSDQCRFASMKTGLLLRLSTGRGVWPYVTLKTGTPDQTTIRADWVVADTFGLEREVSAFHLRWTDTDQATLATCTTFPEAYAALPHRTPEAIRQRARVSGVRLRKARKPSAPKVPRPDRLDDWAPIRGSVPLLDPLWRAADAVVPHGLPQHLREDLVSDMVVLQLEGFTGTLQEAFKAVRRTHNRLTGAFMERSIFDTVPGTDGLRLIDTMADGVSL